MLDGCTEGQVRLVGGANGGEGSVEICYSQKWGRVCDDSWDDQDANVVCRQLGLPFGGISYNGENYIVACTCCGNEIPSVATAATAICCSNFDDEEGPIYIDDVSCRGNELYLANCSHNGVGVHNCNPGEHAGVICAEGEYRYLILYSL